MKVASFIACFKSKTLESVKKPDESDNQTTQCSDESGKILEPNRKRSRCVYY